jgi:hypothetical protein
VKSDLQREDIRTRDRLLDLRDNILREATDALVARILPIRDYAHAQNTDVNPLLLRLEDVEDKIASANEQLRRSVTDFASKDSPIDINAVQRMMRANEALVLHISMGMGTAPLATTCIEKESWAFHVSGVDKVGT